MSRNDASSPSCEKNSCDSEIQDHDRKTALPNKPMKLTGSLPAALGYAEGLGHGPQLIVIRWIDVGKKEA